MKKKLFKIFTALAFVFTFGLIAAPVSASDTTTTETKEEDVVENVVVKYTDTYNMISDKWSADNTELATQLKNEFKTLQETYDKLEFVTIIKGENGQIYYVEVTDKAYKSNLIIEGTETTTEHYLLATLKGQNAKMVFEAPENVDTELLTFTKLGEEAVTIAVSGDLFTASQALCSYHFNDTVKRVKVTAEELEKMTTEELKYEASDWALTPSYNEGAVYDCLKVLDENELIDFELKQNLWNKIVDLFNGNRNILMGTLSIVLGIAVLAAAAYLITKGIKFGKRR